MKTNNAVRRDEGFNEISTSTQTASELRDKITQVLEDGKAEDVRAISLKGKTTIADFLVVATGNSDRHLFALAQRVCDEMAKLGIKGLRIEGESGSEWLLIDVNDVIVHLFKPDARSYYDIETMWSGDFERLLSQAKATSGKSKP